MNSQKSTNIILDSSVVAKWFLSSEEDGDIALKKLAFVIPFLIFFTIFLIQLKPFLEDTYLIFSLDISALVQLIMLVVSLFLVSLFFTIFSALSQDWRMVLGGALVGAAMSLAIFTSPLSFLLTGGYLLAFGLNFASLDGKLQSYLTFQPNVLLGPTIKSLAGFLILVSALAFYLNANMIIARDGFKVPDSLIESAIKIASPQPTSDNLISTPIAQDLIKTAIQDRVQSVIKPYQNYIPVLLAVLLFITLTSLISLISLITPISLFIIFWILEKTGFIHFETEMREVKKLVI